jgi:uncharacterized protein YdbL (DUF1318 family)
VILALAQSVHLHWVTLFLEPTMLRRFAFLVSLVALAAGCSQEVDGDDAEESAADTSSEAALSSAEQSQGRNPVLEAARAQGIIGEQSTGYLGFPDATNKGNCAGWSPRSTSSDVRSTRISPSAIASR